MNKEKYFIDLRKCSEEEKENIKNLTGYQPKNKDCVLMFYDGEWDATTPYHTDNILEAEEKTFNLDQTLIFKIVE